MCLRSTVDCDYNAASCIKFYILISFAYYNTDTCSCNNTSHLAEQFKLLTTTQTVALNTSDIG